MSKFMKYQEYCGSIEPSIEDGCLFGRILFINDKILYEAQSVPELQAAFEEAVDDYLEYCQEKSQEPNKPFSGTFNIRIGEDLHRLAAIKAMGLGLTLNEFVTQTINSSVHAETMNHHHEHSIKVFVSSTEVNTSDKAIKTITAGWEMRNDRPC